MKISKNKVHHLLQEYTKQNRKLKKQHADTPQDIVAISTETKKKVILKKTLDDMYEKLVKKAEVPDLTEPCSSREDNQS
jgi:hypothetical protein